jgi:hypothetical protein
MWRTSASRTAAGSWVGLGNRLGRLAQAIHDLGRLAQAIHDLVATCQHALTPTGR